MQVDACVPGSAGLRLTRLSCVRWASARAADHILMITERSVLIKPLERMRTTGSLEAACGKRDTLRLWKVLQVTRVASLWPFPGGDRDPPGKPAASGGAALPAAVGGVSTGALLEGGSGHEVPGLPDSVMLRQARQEGGRMLVPTDTPKHDAARFQWGAVLSG